MGAASFRSHAVHSTIRSGPRPGGKAMLRIYGSARSRGLRTLWMVGELGLEYEHLDYAARCPQTRTPEYLAMNPNGAVPTIDDDGFVLSESMAINFYLAKKHGKLCPADA